MATQPLFADALHEGRIGLWSALCHYDPKCGTAFSTYEVRLGYQAALVSLQRPTYGRLWLSVKQHPGDPVATTRLHAMVQAAEAATGVRLRRRTELLKGPIAEQQSLLEAAREQETRTQERAAQARAAAAS